MKLILKLFAPYLAVLIFWCFIPNAWLAILVYHLQILFWSRKSLSDPQMPKLDLEILFTLPAALAAPLLYVLLPYITHTDLSTWLQSYGLSGWSFILMIPYFGIIHPCLEQLHWNRLRKSTQWSHPLFAGYHMIVLSTLLTLPWLIACFAILTAASYIWLKMEEKTSSPILAIVSHILADLGIIVVAYLTA